MMPEGFLQLDLEEAMELSNQTLDKDLAAICKFLIKNSGEGMGAELDFGDARLTTRIY